MSGSKDRSGSNPDGGSANFDGVWEQLTEGQEAPQEDGGTRAWTEEVRAQRKRDADAVPSVEVAPPSSGDETKLWTEEVRAERKRDGGEPVEDRMAQLMKESAEAPAVVDEEVLPSASASMARFEIFGAEAPRVERAADEMDRLMRGAEAASDAAEPGKGFEGGDMSPEAIQDDPSPSEDEDSSSEPESESESDATDDDEASQDDAEASLAAPIPIRPVDSVPPVQRDEPVQRAPEEPEPGSRGWIWWGAAAVVGLGVYLAFSSGGPSPEPSEATVGEVAQVGGAQAPESPSGPEARPEQVEDLAKAADPRPDVPPPRGAVPPEEPAPSGDPREPPAGTPPEIAAAFKKIPVSPADRPPVGGVGKSGVHIDHIATGTEYERSRCTGASKSFSVGAGEQANVCLRVVHQRQKEELVVVWQKKGGNARRGKIVVKPTHAYRTRAYLKLRSEYVGEWSVKILSADGVELASRDFAVVP